jgi:uncharacterized protein
MTPTWNNEPDMDELRRLHALLSANPSQALVGLRGLAERGSLMSMIYVANAHSKGIGTDVNPRQAEEWYRRAIVGGSVLASYELGRNFLEKKDFRGAQEMFSAGTEKVYPPSMHMLALMHLRGQGVPVDLTKARNLLEMAVAQGHVFSKRNLGLLLMKGRFGIRQFFRGILLLLASAKDVLITAARDPLSDRLR